MVSSIICPYFIQGILGMYTVVYNLLIKLKVLRKEKIELIGKIPGIRSNIVEKFTYSLTVIAVTWGGGILLYTIIRSYLNFNGIYVIVEQKILQKIKAKLLL
uniref:Uncharacterized protein n=1 Tax=Heterostelium pallidum TaxID=13642 RepID=B2XX32_HETPA|nr:hypothetical protein [Heterostelium pallidum]